MSKPKHATKAEVLIFCPHCCCSFEVRLTPAYATAPKDASDLPDFPRPPAAKPPATPTLPYTPAPTFDQQEREAVRDQAARAARRFGIRPRRTILDEQREITAQAARESDADQITGAFAPHDPPPACIGSGGGPAQGSLP